MRESYTVSKRAVDFQLTLRTPADPQSTQAARIGLCDVHGVTDELVCARAFAPRARVRGREEAAASGSHGYSSPSAGGGSGTPSAAMPSRSVA